jgi:hypothetical protein
MLCLWAVRERHKTPRRCALWRMADALDDASHHRSRYAAANAQGCDAYSCSWSARRDACRLARRHGSHDREHHLSHGALRIHLIRHAADDPHAEIMERLSGVQDMGNTACTTIERAHRHTDNVMVASGPYPRLKLRVLSLWPEAVTSWYAANISTAGASRGPAWPGVSDRTMLYTIPPQRRTCYNRPIMVV